MTQFPQPIMITVLTPTYNRAHTLSRLYASLVNQSHRDFEWLVVDDGSSDGTEGLIAQFDASKVFPIRYLFQSNGGKHSAINAGVRHAQGEWILIVDSDDALLPDAIGSVRDAVRQHEESPGIVGLCFRKCSFNGALVGQASTLAGPISLHPTEASAMFKGDLAYVFKRRVMQLEPFPIIAGEKFVPELFVWNRIGDIGRILFFPTLAIYCCEYLEDGYSANFKQNLRRNPRGFLLFYMAQFQREKSIYGQVKCVIRSLQCTWYSMLNRLQT